MGNSARQEPWLDMEKVIATWLQRHGLTYVGERLSHQSGRDHVDYDFIVPGAVPLLIEVKYEQFRNVAMVQALARTAVDAFGRCRFVLIIVGEADETWNQVDGLVSAVRQFNTRGIVGDVDEAAERFVDGVLSGVEELPTIGAGKAKSVRHALDHDLLDDWPQNLPGASAIQSLFSEHLEDALEVVAASFKSIVQGGAGAPSVVDVELRELAKEYASGHFTSCALRLGRCLELVVYAFARRIGVDPSQGQFKMLLNVNDRWHGLAREMLDLAEMEAEADTAALNQQRAKLETAIIKMQEELSRVLPKLHDVTSQPREARGPANIQAILRRGQRRLAKLDGSGEAQARLGTLLREGRAQEVLELRNRAAHGDPGLAHREVDEETVRDRAFVVAQYVQDLATVVSLMP